MTQAVKALNVRGSVLLKVTRHMVSSYIDLHDNPFHQQRSHFLPSRKIKPADYYFGSELAVLATRHHIEWLSVT